MEVYGGYPGYVEQLISTIEQCNRDKAGVVQHEQNR
ncbi:hypothetical protein HNR62_001042 [Oceanisphaera litoralis]|nr:hypothetical protein [Oceanisphaera litoralis]